jgi:hypothetical protein
MAEQIQNIQKQTFRYYYEDGLVELAVGILFTIIGLDTFVISSSAPGSPLAITAWVLLPILTIGGIIGVQNFVKVIKERHVHPRTGYIEYSPKPRRSRWLVSGIVLALTISFLLLPYDWLQRGSVTGGMILFVILATIGISVSLKRLIWVGAFSMVLGTLFAFLPITDNASLAATFFAVGPVLILIGSLAFRAYLANNPLTGESQ